MGGWWCLVFVVVLFILRLCTLCMFYYVLFIGLLSCCFCFFIELCTTLVLDAFPLERAAVLVYGFGPSSCVFGRVSPVCIFYVLSVCFLWSYSLWCGVFFLLLLVQLHRDLYLDVSPCMFLYLSTCFFYLYSMSSCWFVSFGFISFS